MRIISNIFGDNIKIIFIQNIAAGHHLEYRNVLLRRYAREHTPRRLFQMVCRISRLNRPKINRLMHPV